MRRAALVIIILLLLAAGGLWLGAGRPYSKGAGRTTQDEHTNAHWTQAASPSGARSNSPNDAQAGVGLKSAINALTSEFVKKDDEWRTPIEFYGRVIDENTNGIPDADVQFVWTDISPTGNSQKAIKSDSGGFFALRNEAGKHLVVKVSKKGYYSYEPFGLAFFYAGENQNFVPDSSSPVIFRVKKKGFAEPLVHIQAPMGGPKGFKIAKDGSMVEISLTTGRAVTSGKGDFQVQCWTEDQEKRPGERYNWKCSITIRNGGILQYTNDLEFEAPLNGYTATDVIEMPATLDPGWSNAVTRKYFVKLPNGTFARINFQMIAGGDHFFLLESFLNPSGSRNLEFDPQLTLNP